MLQYRALLQKYRPLLEMFGKFNDPAVCFGGECWFVACCIDC